MQNYDTWNTDQVIRLKACVFERCIENIKSKRVNNVVFTEELAWLYSDENKQPFSALVCARAAGFDLEIVRFKLDLELTQEKRDRIRLIDNGRYDAINFEGQPSKSNVIELHLWPVA